MRIALATTALLALAACDSSGASGTSGQYQVVAANENAISIEVNAPGYSDRGAGLAQTHCSQFGKVAQAESSTPTFGGYQGLFVYRCL
jgi:hypothetical protein